jgi:hypothetical protein
MKKNSLFLLMTLLATLTVYGKDASFMGQDNLTGTWIIDTTIIKQTVDGVSTIKTYLAGDTAVTFVQRPLKIIITADEITFVYPAGIQKGRYTIDSNKLLIDLPGRIAEYQYILIDSNKIQLHYTIQYVIDGVHQAEEQCNFKGKIVSEIEN